MALLLGRSASKSGRLRHGDGATRGQPLPEGARVGYLFLTGAAIALAPMRTPVHAQEYKAQQAAKVRKVGELHPGSGSRERLAALR